MVSLPPSGVIRRSKADQKQTRHRTVMSIMVAEWSRSGHVNDPKLTRQ